MNSFKKYLQELGRSTSTIEGYGASLKRVEQWATSERLSLDELSYTDVLAYTKHCQQNGAGKITVNNYLLAIKHYFNHLIEEGKANENPAQHVYIKGAPRKRLYDIFTPLELESIYHRFCNKDFRSRYSFHHQVKYETEHLRNKVITGLLVYQGLRTDEIIHLRTEDVKLRKGVVEIPEVKDSNSREMKLEASQVMDMHQYVSEGRKEILDSTGKQTEKLFISVGSSTALHNTLQKLLKQLQRIEPRIKSLRQLRASVIVKWLKNYNLRQVQYLAGHKWISSTEMYLQNEMKGLQEEVNKYHPLG